MTSSGPFALLSLALWLPPATVAAEDEPLTATLHLSTTEPEQGGRLAFELRFQLDPERLPEGVDLLNRFGDGYELGIEWTRREDGAHGVIRCHRGGPPWTPYRAEDVLWPLTKAPPPTSGEVLLVPIGEWSLPPGAYELRGRVEYGLGGYSVHEDKHDRMLRQLVRTPAVAVTIRPAPPTPWTVSVPTALSIVCRSEDEVDGRQRTASFIAAGHEPRRFELAPGVYGMCHVEERRLLPDGGFLELGGGMSSANLFDGSSGTGFESWFGESDPQNTRLLVMVRYEMHAPGGHQWSGSHLEVLWGAFYVAELGDGSSLPAASIAGPEAERAAMLWILGDLHQRRPKDLAGTLARLREWHGSIGGPVGALLDGRVFEEWSGAKVEGAAWVIVARPEDRDADGRGWLVDDRGRLWSARSLFVAPYVDSERVFVAPSPDRAGPWVLESVAGR